MDRLCRGMVRSTSDRDAACHIPEEEFRARMDSLFHGVPAPAIRGAVLDAINWCFGCNRPIPGWVQSDFCNAYGDVTSGLSNHGMMDSVARTRRAHSRPPPAEGADLHCR